MSDASVVLVTGVAGYWGARVAARLLEDPDLHVIGLDVEPPENDLDGLDYVQADIRNPLLAQLLREEGVDTVFHLAFAEGVRRSEAAFDYNVMGTMKVCGACAVAGVGKVVLKSSTTVYGAHPDNTAFLTEDSELRGSRRYGYNRYRLEIESFCNGFRRQVPEVMLTVLRFASVVGPTADTPLNRYLSDSPVPTLMGFNPMLQVIHEDDVVAALVHAGQNDASGVFNVAADPPMPLKRILGLVGRLPLPIFHPLMYRGTAWLGNTRLRRQVPFEPDYLRYRWVADVQKMQNELGFWPAHPADEAVKALGTHMRMEQYEPRTDDMAYDENRLRATLEQRRRAREQ